MNFEEEMRKFESEIRRPAFQPSSVRPSMNRVPPPWQKQRPGPPPGPPPAASVSAAPQISKAAAASTSSKPAADDDDDIFAKLAAYEKEHKKEVEPEKKKKKKKVKSNTMTPQSAVVASKPAEPIRIVPAEAIRKNEPSAPSMMTPHQARPHSLNAVPPPPGPPPGPPPSAVASQGGFNPFKSNSMPSTGPNTKATLPIAISSTLKSSVLSGATAGGMKQESKPEEPMKKYKKPKRMIRLAGGQTWEDDSLRDWDPNDFRIFCGDLGNDVTDEVLTRTFSRYGSFTKAKVIRDKRTNKTKGYGFVSFKDPVDFTKAMKEINGKYIGSRPIKLRKSNWKDRNADQVRKKEKQRKEMGYK